MSGAPRPRTSRRIAAAAVAIGVALLAAAAPASADTPYDVGTARVNVTPPAYRSAQDAQQFPSCDTGVFSGPRQWAFEEPYTDMDGSGSFNYPGGLPEPFCDANANGRWDGIYISGGVDHPAGDVHDPIDARAVAIGHGQHAVVVVSVVAQGIFQDYIEEARAEAQRMRPGIDDVIVSANHNESSPDTIGIYGAPEDPTGTAGEHSGIDEYYMRFLDDQIAKAAVNAYDARQPASLWVREFQLTDKVQVRLSNNFPTTNDDESPAAIDPKVRVLQARDASGNAIATVMNLAAHNQEIGHADDAPYDISSDWPGYFHNRLEQQVGGMAMFLVGDNGSEEDPQTVPEVPCSGTCYEQAQATGETIAHQVATQVPRATEIAGGQVASERHVFFAPLENNLFKAAAGAGLFGDKRQLYTDGIPSGRVGNELRTEVGVVTVGPDLQLIASPGEAFPALMLGSPWGQEEASCPERPNPGVPAWHASATHRFELGLADDMIGYLSPAWAYVSIPGAFNYDGPPDNGGPATCTTDSDEVDSKGHKHKLETEGAGPTASNLVADNLAELLDHHPDPAAEIRPGRFVYADGSLSRRPQRSDGSGGTEDAVGVWLADQGSTSLTPGSGTVVALPNVVAFGDRHVDANGDFMDYDGQDQGAPDITTRGMLVGPEANPSKRYYLNVFPPLDASPLGAAERYCHDVTPPSSRPQRARIHVGAHALRIAGKSRDQGCAADNTHAARPGEVKSVDVAISKRLGHDLCRNLRGDGRLGRRLPCSQRAWLPAKGTESWRLAVALARPLPPGRYRARSRAADAAGNVEPYRRSSVARLRVR